MSLCQMGNTLPLHLTHQLMTSCVSLVSEHVEPICWCHVHYFVNTWVFVQGQISVFNILYLICFIVINLCCFFLINFLIVTASAFSVVALAVLSDRMASLGLIFKDYSPLLRFTVPSRHYCCCRQGLLVTKFTHKSFVRFTL